MPYYGIPVDQTNENVAMAYNKEILTDLLRKELGFEGVICTDWGIISGRHWGVDDLSIRERFKKSIEAGVDQYGGESSPEYVIDLVNNDEISEERIDFSVSKILRNKFELGLFEEPFVDEGLVDSKVGIKSYCEKGLLAQKKSIVLLKNDLIEGKNILPLNKNIKVFVDGFNKNSFKDYCDVCEEPGEADYILLQLRTVFNGKQPSGINLSLIHI